LQPSGCWPSISTRFDAIGRAGGDLAMVFDLPANEVSPITVPVATYLNSVQSLGEKKWNMFV
jgi:hypothetical protein